MPKTSMRFFFLYKLTAISYPLFFSLLMLRLLAAELAELIELQFACDELLIFARPIVDMLAIGTRKLDELILRHRSQLYP